VDPEQWKWLVNYWDSEKFRVRWRTLFYYSFSMHFNIKFFVMCFFLSCVIAALQWDKHYKSTISENASKSRHKINSQYFLWDGMQFSCIVLIIRWHELCYYRNSINTHESYTYVIIWMISIAKTRRHVWGFQHRNNIRGTIIFTTMEDSTKKERWNIVWWAYREKIWRA